MPAFWRRMRPAQAPERTERTPSAPPSFRSRALSYLLEGRPKDRAWQVLDLGVPNQNNLDFFARRGANYAIEDLYRTLEPSRKGQGYDVSRMEALDNLLSFGEGTTFDLILAWDVLNFLPREALALISSRLAPHCRPGTELYALITMEAAIPALPGNARILDEETIGLAGWDGERSRPSPHHTAAVLGEAMAPFVVDKTYLLKLQMHEFLVEYRPGQDPVAKGPIKGGRR
ncbi:MAG: hypothetical protein K8J08_04640 [Thermoanaerobaculia bacterium]|nr:hypothetical protein [Thermoanaerobaculia bacterium]